MRRSRTLFAVLSLSASLVAVYGETATAPRFYPDDPLLAEPAPLPVDPSKIVSRKLSDYWDFFANEFGELGQRNQPGKLYPAGGVNTLGEVLDSTWFTNRHERRPLSLAELVRGPVSGVGAPAEGQWTVIGAKTEGVTPGFTIKDSRGITYVIKFDPVEEPEIGTSADVIGSKFFHAIGYHVPENHIVFFRPEDLVVGESATIRDADGKKRPMSANDIYFLLQRIPWRPGQKVRASASRYLQGRPLGPFRFYGTRQDDPNDIVRHEHRRDLRGYRVFCAWLDHDDSRAINSLDMLVEEQGKHYVRHYLIDFGSILGSASNRPNSARAGFEPLFAWKPAAIQFFTLGLYVPPYARAHYPGIPGAGRFEWEQFDPLAWVPEYPNSAFLNTLPDDGFWAAKIVMSFTDAEIRALVETGQYSDPRAVDWLTECLIRRRDKTGRAWFNLVLPLDRFAVRDGRLEFEDLGVKYGFVQPRAYTWSWAAFDNRTGQTSILPGASGPELPVDAAKGESLLRATIHAGSPKLPVVAYLRRDSGGWQVVGLERTFSPDWPKSLRR